MVFGDVGVQRYLRSWEFSATTVIDELRVCFPDHPLPGIHFKDPFYPLPFLGALGFLAPWRFPLPFSLYLFFSLPPRFQ